MKTYSLILQLFLIACLTSGCLYEMPDKNPAERKFSVQTLAKNDISNFLDVEVYQLRQLSHQLMIKLYKRNPKQLNKSPFKYIDKNVSRVFDEHHDWSFKQLGYKQNIDALQLTFDEDYQGDRVFYFIVGLSSMLMKSYGNKTDFYILDNVDGQALYNSARNIEIAVWKLTHNKHKNK